MPILIKDELLEKYNEIWKEFKNSIIREFGNEPVIVGHTPIKLVNLMEKLDSALHLWIVLYTNYFNFWFSYLHTFYKPNNIKNKASTKVKTYIQI